MNSLGWLLDHGKCFSSSTQEDENVIIHIISSSHFPPTKKLSIIGPKCFFQNIFREGVVFSNIPLAADQLVL